MCYGTCKGIARFIRTSKKGVDQLTEIRIDIAKHLTLGLELLVGKDIIETIVRPGMEDLLTLCVLVGIRTILAYILTKEIKGALEEMEEEQELEQAFMNFEIAQEEHRKHHSHS